MTILLDFYGLDMIIKDTCYMREPNELAMPDGNSTPNEPSEGSLSAGISRRDFLKLSAVLAGSTVLMVNGCNYLEQVNPQLDFGLPPVPREFRRFILTRVELGQLQPRTTEIALGSQHQNLQVSLLAYDQPDVQFFNTIQDVLKSFNGSEQVELRWID